MKRFFIKYRPEFLGFLFGAVAGLIYWYIWGEEDPSSVRTIWWTVVLWGGVCGALLFSIIKDRRDEE